MTTHRTTRRAMLAGAASVPIAALASAASAAPAAEASTRASPISDPVFAAIKKHRRFTRGSRPLVSELGELEEKLPKEITRRPRAALYPELDFKATRIEQFPTALVIRLKRGADGKNAFCELACGKSTMPRGTYRKNIAPPGLPTACGVKGG